jgi:hypothetical protein
MNDEPDELMEKEQEALSAAFERGKRIGAVEERAKMTQELKNHGFDGITSGRKVAKKLRQYYGRSLEEQANERVNGMYKTFEEHIRPKPKWIPAIVWRVIQRCVLMHYVDK